MAPEIQSETDKIFCHFGPFFALLTPLALIIPNGNHMMYGSGDMEGDRHNFFVILDHFVPFYPPPMVPENQDFEKMKKILKILSFYKCVP